MVTHLGLLGARGQHPRERPIRVGPEDHPLLLAVQGEAVVEQLRALLTPVAAPIAAVGAGAIEAGKDVEGVGGGHGCSPRSVGSGVWIQTGNHGEAHRRWTPGVRRIGCGPTVVPANASLPTF